jgi:hypothetical protein
MNKLKVIGIITFLILILYFIIGAFLPSKVHFEASVDMKTKVDLVFDQINNLKNWKTWTPYQDSISNMKFYYEGNPKGVGAIMKWQKENHIDGSLTLTEVIPNKRIKGDLIFEGHRKSTITFDFLTQNDTVRVKWSYDISNLSYPLERYMSLFMKPLLKPDFKKRLNKLKLLCENKDFALKNDTASIVKDTAIIDQAEKLRK